ncbi:MAG: PH domain-containing protein [Mycobacteriales bacterium]
MTDWHRLHPLTPLLRGWRFLLVLGAAVGQQSLQRGGVDPTYVGLAVLAGTALAVLSGFVVWRTTRYRLTTTELQVDSGLLRRRSRRVPVARLQSVDVVRPVIARVLGLAELRLEVVGGARAEAPLAYLTEDQAQQLRAQLLGAVAGRTTEPAEPPEDILVHVPTETLVASVLLGAPLGATAVLLLVAIVTAGINGAAVVPVLAAALPAYAGFLSVAGKRVLAEYGFTVAESPEGLRLRHGLLDTRSQTIPPGRVQGIRLVEPLLWRPFGWVRVEVDVAGYAGGHGEQQSATKALLPVAPRGLAEALTGRVLGGALPAALAPVPPRVRWRAPLSRPRLRAGVDGRHLVVTSGVLTRTTDVVPLAKVQSLRVTAGPWQQRLRLATLHADSAGRRLPGAKAEHRDADEAYALMAELAVRTRSARAGGVPQTPGNVGAP